MPALILPTAAALTPHIALFFGISSATAAGVAAGVVSAATVATNIVISAALSAGVGLLARRTSNQRTSLSDSGGAGRVINSTEIRLNTRQEVPSVRWVYGEVMIGGALFFEESIDQDFYQGFLWSEGPITEILELRNTQELLIMSSYEFDRILDVSTNIEGKPPYVGMIQLSARRGTIDQPIDPILAADFPALDPTTFRQRGVATLVSKANFGADYEEFDFLWGSARRPNPIARIRGVPVYDPRDPSQRLPTNPDDPEDLEDARLTWKWSNTASLVQADYLWRPNGGRIPLSQIRWDEIGDSATYDDQLIGVRGGGSIKRHTIDGVVTAGQMPLEIMQSMLTANRGFVARNNGRVWIQSSQPVDPVITITDDDLTGAVELRRTRPRRDLLNRVRCRFVDPRQEWTSVDGPILDMPALRAVDGDVYEAALELPWTADHRRAQRLQRAFLEDSRVARAVQLGVNIQLLGLKAGDAVRLQLKALPNANGIYRLNQVAMDEQMTELKLSATEYDAMIDRRWNPEIDEQPFTLPELIDEE